MDTLMALSNLDYKNNAELYLTRARQYIEAAENESDSGKKNDALSMANACQMQAHGYAMLFAGRNR